MRFLWNNSYSKLVICVCILLFFPIFLISFALSQSFNPIFSHNDTPHVIILSPTPIPYDIVKVENAPFNKGHHVVRISIIDPTEVYFEDIDANRLLKYASVSGLLYQENPNGEVRNGNIYIPRKSSDAGSNGSANSFDIWKYDPNGKGVKVKTVHGDSFVISNYEEELAVADSTDFSIMVDSLSQDGNGSSFYIDETLLDKNHISPNTDRKIELFKWDSWNDAIWGGFFVDGISEGIFFKYTPFKKDGDLITFYSVLSTKGVGTWEMDISPFFPQLVFSNYNTTSEKSPVNLFLVNLDTTSEKTIAINRLHNYFHPYFREPDTISIMDEAGGGRKNIKLTL